MEQFPGEQKEQSSERNIRTHTQETIEAIALVEGPSWVAEQETSEQSFTKALQQLTDGKSAIIYGRGGINRWFVAADGSVTCSESHAQSPEHLARARELDFEITS